MRRAHGIRGDVLVRGLVEDASDRFVEGATLAIGGDESPSDPVRSVTVVNASRHAGDFIVKLAGIDTRTDAEDLIGVRFVIEKSARRQLADGEWWAEDLIGCAVVDLAGVRIGTVSDVVTGASQDRLEVRTETGSTGEIPFVDPLVPVVDVAARTITVDLPDGLLP